MIGGIVEAFRSALEREPSVRAVFLCGSHVTGLATAQSDIDFTVLVDDDAGVEAVKARLAEAYEYLGDSHEVPRYRAGRAELAVCIYPQLWTDAWVANAFRSPEDLKQWQGWLRHKVVDARPVSDPEGVLEEYQRQLADYPAELAGEVVTEALEYLRGEYLEDCNFRNEFHFAYCLRDMLEQVGLALFALNRRFYAPPLKHWQQDLPELEPDLTADLAGLVSLSEGADLASRHGVLQRIVEKLAAAQRT